MFRYRRSAMGHFGTGVRFTRFHPSTMKLSQIAHALNARLDNGSADTEITGLNGIEQAGPEEITFVANQKYAPAARLTKAAAVIVAENFPAIPAATLRVAGSLPKLRPRPRTLPSAAALRSRNSCDSNHSSQLADWTQRPHRTLRGHRRRCQ